MRRRRIIVPIVALGAVVATSLMWKVGPWSSRTTGSVEGLAVPAPGHETVLSVTWRERSTVRLAKGESAGLADTIEGETDLDADLVLTRETTIDGGDAVRAELRDVRRARVVVSGQIIVEPSEGAKTLEGRPIHLVLEDGRIARVLVDKDAPTLAVQLTENVARQVLVRHPNEGALEREEDTPSGRVKVRYESKGGGTYARTVTEAISLEGLPERCEAPCAVRARGEGEVRFEGDGAVARLTEARSVRAGVEGAPPMLESTATFEARRVADAQHVAEAIDPKKLAAKPLGEPFENEADRRAALQRRAEGASIEEILGGISTIASSGAEGLPKGWLVRSTALLELEPKLLAEVAIRFEDEGIGSAGRAAILDLLASTGGDEAKAVLLRVLDSPAAREDDERLALVQRLMLVEDPNADLARALRDRLTRSQAEGDAQMAYAEAHVLGAMAGRLAARGSRAEAKASTDAIAKSLDAATTPAARAAYLGALGNAGDPSQIARVARHARDEDPGVRRAVASALRKTNEPAARATLVELAKDPDEDVQVAAVDALSHHLSTPTEQRELALLLEGAQLGGEAEAQAVTALLRQGAPAPEVRGSLEQVLARTEDPRLAARIRFALEASSAAN